MSISTELILKQFTVAKFKRKIFDNDKLKKRCFYYLTLDFKNNINDFIYENAFHREVLVHVYSMITCELLVSLSYEDLGLFLSDWKIERIARTVNIDYKENDNLYLIRSTSKAANYMKLMHDDYICTIIFPAYKNGMYISVKNPLDGEAYMEIIEVDFNKSIDQIIDNLIDKYFKRGN